MSIRDKKDESDTEKENAELEPKNKDTINILGVNKFTSDKIVIMNIVPLRLDSQSKNSAKSIRLNETAKFVEVRFDEVGNKTENSFKASDHVW
jgi:hypothetical protein